MNKGLINRLQHQTSQIRNFCILAHVDHGKTTLADTLLASNGIISSRMSGKLRYMDSRQDEQERGITMKASAISLVHTDSSQKQFLINLIDSPGHVDFSSEVSTAIRLCDGAIILVDVCEGICPQTHAVLRQASQESLKLVLVFNKIDRLIGELKMTPLEAYYHMQMILEQFNALVAEQFSSLVSERMNRQAEHEDQDVEWEEEVDESQIYFSPKYRNVFFTSAIDGWGFSIETFAEIYSTKLNFRKDTLLQTLWGDYYLNSKTKRIMREAQNKGKKPLFVQLILENIWQIYEAVYTRRDQTMTSKIIQSLGLNSLKPRDLKYTEAKGPLQALFSHWLPLGRNLLTMLVNTLPSPLDMSANKVEYLICPRLKHFKSLPKATQALKDDFMICDAGEGRPVIVFISKMFAAEKDSLNKKPVITMEEITLRREAIRLKKLQIQEEGLSKVEFTEPTTTVVNEYPSAETVDEELEEEEKPCFLAFARVFSGTLRRGQTLFILSPKHNPEDLINTSLNIDSSPEEIAAVSRHVAKFTVSDLYLMMGRELELVEEVPAGNIAAIGGLEGLVHKSATLTTELHCPAFSAMFMQTSPIVRVAVEPRNPAKMKELVRGLRLLNQSDPCVEVIVQANGEHILCTAGEVHLQRCLDDLEQRFAGIQLSVSAPIIPFRETIVPPPEFDNVNEKIVLAQEPSTNPDGIVELHTFDRRASVKCRARPLPTECAQFLLDSSTQLKLLTRLNSDKVCPDSESRELLISFKARLDELLEPVNWSVQNIIAFGPNATILFNSNCNTSSSVWTVMDSLDAELKTSPNRAKPGTKELENSAIFGFNLAVAKGPMCEEPMQSVAFFVDKLNLLGIEDNDKKTDVEEEGISESVTSGVSGASQLISLTKECLKQAFELQPQRLMVAMLKCQVLTVSSEALGKLYAVLGKRNARITEESMKEGTSMFIIEALLPMADSFGLAEEMRKKTSGLASPHIEFSHFEVLDLDPNWEPKTEEERLLLGDKADTENMAKRFVNDVRKRKGLFVKEKLVQDAEKQRTMAYK